MVATYGYSHCSCADKMRLDNDDDVTRQQERSGNGTVHEATVPFAFTTTLPTFFQTRLSQVLFAMRNNDRNLCIPLHA